MSDAITEHLRAAGWGHHGEPYPHAGGCNGCRAERVCNVCGVEIGASSRCTNGRCLDCHVYVCTGADAEGHGYGTAERARARADRT